MNAERIEEIRKRAEAATAGPWKYYAGCVVTENEGDAVLYANIGEEVDGLDADIEFVEHAREDIPALLAEIDWMRKELAQCHRQIELAEEQLTRYGDVKRKLHELQDFIYPDRDIAERIERVESDPESTVAWTDIRREGGAE